MATKTAEEEKHIGNGHPYDEPIDPVGANSGENILRRDLQGRHMQMIAM